MAPDELTPQQREHFRRLRRFAEEELAFNAFLGLQSHFPKAGECIMTCPYRPAWIGDPHRPAIHGGLVSTLADTAGGMAVISSELQFPKLSTVDLRIDYLRHGLPLDIHCHATLLRLGNRVAVTRMLVTQQEGNRVIAEGRGVYNVLWSTSESEVTS